MRSRPRIGVARLSIDQALSVGAARFPGATTVWVRVPQDPLDAYDLQMRQAGTPMTRFPRTHVWLDQFSGRVLAVHDPRQDDPAETVLDWVQPLHDGKAFELVGRLTVMMAGTAPAALLATGMMRWLHKRTSRNKGRLRRKPSPSCARKTDGP